MAIGVTLFIVGIAIVLIWFLIEFKRVRHKVFAIFLIGLILFTYFSFTSVVKKNGVDLGETSGWIDAGGLYVSWLGGLFGNARSITSHAVGLDWGGEAGNQTG